MERLLVISALALAACSASDKAPRLEAQLVSALPASLPTALPELVQAALDPVPDLKKVVAQPSTPPWAPKDPSWGYIFDVDYGIRTDEGGKGTFLAPRAHGHHNGVDFLAPVGTPTLAACDGKARADKRGGYGNVVQLVCRLPDALGGDEGLHASLFYAHLDKSAVPSHWVNVKLGQKLGTVGKTGNAKGPKIKPHLHLEVIVRGSEEDAMKEHHSGVVPEAKVAADRFFELLSEECLTPAHFAANQQVRRERRSDPFVLLLCTSRPKPELSAPAADLREAQIKWSSAYTAGGFDVDRGPR